jgi:hypothetical protein
MDVRRATALHKRQGCEPVHNPTGACVSSYRHRQSKENVMMRRHFETRAELERQMEAARQLRAETLGGAAWIVSGLAAVLGVIRRMLLRMTARASSQT